MRSYISVWSCSIWFSVCCFPLVLCPVDPSSHWPPLNKQNPIPITSTKMHALKWLNFTKSLWFGKKRPLTTICHCSWEITFPKCVNAPFPTHEKYIEYQTLYVRHIYLPFLQFNKICQSHRKGLAASNLFKSLSEYFRTQSLYSNSSTSIHASF